MRDQILQVASGLFYREGIRAIGIDRVISEADIAKATLYRHFPSKELLVEAYLQSRHEGVIASFNEVLARSHDDPQQRIAAIFAMLREKADSPDFRGCAFALAVGEQEASKRVTDVARAHKAALRKIFRDVTAPLGEGSDNLAAHLALLYEGALASVAVDRNPQIIDVAKQCAMLLLQQIRR